MTRRKAAEPPTESPRPTIVFSASAWRERIAQELVTVGLDHDRARLVAVSVLKGIVQGADSPAPAD